MVGKVQGGEEAFYIPTIRPLCLLVSLCLLAMAFLSAS